MGFTVDKDCLLIVTALIYKCCCVFAVMVRVGNFHGYQVWQSWVHKPKGTWHWHCMVLILKIFMFLKDLSRLQSASLFYIRNNATGTHLLVASLAVIVSEPFRGSLIAHALQLAHSLAICIWSVFTVWANMNRLLRRYLFGTGAASVRYSALYQNVCVLGTVRIGQFVCQQIGLTKKFFSHRIGLTNQS